MPSDPGKVEGPTPETGPGREGRLTVAGVAGRLGAVVVIILAALLMAHVLARPSGCMEETPGTGGTAAPDAWPPPAPHEPDGEGASPPPSERDVQADLRRTLAGVLMAAAGEEGKGEYALPENATPEARRRLLAQFFGVPLEHPRAGIPPDLVPPDAQILMAAEHPSTAGARMVLARVKKGVDETLADFYNHYARGEGWSVRGPEAAPRDEDRGWLLTFERRRQWRAVFVMPRTTAPEETLVAVYDGER